MWLKRKKKKKWNPKTASPNSCMHFQSSGKHVFWESWLFLKHFIDNYIQQNPTYCNHSSHTLVFSSQAHHTNTSSNIDIMRACTTYKLLIQLEYIFYLTTLLFARRNRITLTKSLFYPTNHIPFFSCTWEQKVERCVIPVWTEGEDDVH